MKFLFCAAAADASLGKLECLSPSHFARTEPARLDGAYRTLTILGQV